MDIREYFTGPKVVILLDTPMILTHPPGGGEQIEKAGIIAVGSTLAAAKADWWYKFTEMIARPRLTP
jgi:hypothetical protein